MHSLRRSAWLVVAAAFLPLLLFLIFQSAFAARQEREDIRSRALALTRQIIVATDGIVQRHLTGVDVLATARSLESGDLNEFRSRATQIIRLSPDWVAAELIDEKTATPIVSINVPLGTRTYVNPEGAPGRPWFAGFANGPNCPCMILERRAHAPGQHWLLRVFVSTKELSATLPRAKGTYEVSAIVGPHGRFIVRSIGNDLRFGQLGSDSLVAAVRGGHAQGFYRGKTLEGFENYTAFTRSRQTGWSAHVALGSQSLDNPARRFLASLGLAALLSLLLAAVLIWFAIRQFAQARQIDERLRQTQKLEALGQLTGGIAHDFNNLLTPIVGALDFLAKGAEPGSRPRRIAEGALASAHRAAKLTGQLLAFSRKQRMAIAPIDVTAMIAEMRSMLEQSAGPSNELRISVPDQPICALSDLHQLELAILNLVLNARDASEGGSPIEVGVRPLGENEVSITIVDRGTGMTEEVRRRAVEPFFTTKVVGSGTGLGLAQAFGVAEQSGGRLEIDSTPGIGTTIAIVLRRCEAVTLPLAGRTIEAAGSEPRMRLLLVDDDLDVRSILAHSLELAGHYVDSVADGATALAAVQNQAYDVVIVDYQMPRMNGAELIARAREIRPEVRFLMITGYAESETLQEIAPDVPILRKPADPDALVAAVREAAA